MESIRNILSQYRKVSLDDLDKVALMNRIDLKFCFHISHAPKVFELIQDNYSALEINGETIFPYYNTYFDTADDQMYLNHHNGKLNRYKIRVRKYNQTNVSFLEIKFKNNKGRTIKKRVVRDEFHEPFNPSELEFINRITPYSGNQLCPKIINSFHRITLVNNNFTERVTIDFTPEFKNNNHEITLQNLVIVEIKQDKSGSANILTQTLRELKLTDKGFSKYCIGRSLIEDIKKNKFKPLLIKIEKEYSN